GDYVMDAVGPSVVPSVAEIRTKFTARRGSGSRGEQAVRRILGIDLKMKQYQQGAHFVSAVVEQAGMAVFNRVWTCPETLPIRAEIPNPARWIERVGSAAIPGAAGNGGPRGSLGTGSADGGSAGGASAAGGSADGAADSGAAEDGAAGGAAAG